MSDRNSTTMGKFDVGEGVVTEDRFALTAVTINTDRTNDAELNLYHLTKAGEKGDWAWGYKVPGTADGAGRDIAHPLLFPDGCYYVLTGSGSYFAPEKLI